MNTAFALVLSDSGLDRQLNSTADDLTHLYSVVAAIGNLTQTVYAGTSASAAYTFVLSEIVDAGVAPHTLQALQKFFAHRIARHSMGL